MSAVVIGSCSLGAVSFHLIVVFTVKGKLEKLPSVEDRGETNRVTALCPYALDIDL